MVKVNVGDTVIIHNGYRNTVQRTYEATVTKVARIWITVGEGYSARRFRLDDQTDGTGEGWAKRFYTLEQWAEREKLNAAHAYLHKQGISLRSDSPWRGKETELADVLKRLDNDAHS
jgi:hypothetical protein